MSELIRKQHYGSRLLYHLACRVKYRKAIFIEKVDEKLKKICQDIALRCEIKFLEIGNVDDHVHFFVQSAPMSSPQRSVQIIKCRKSKKQLRGRQFRSDGYLVSTVDAHALEENIKQYIKNQGVAKVTIQPRLF